uniref:Nitroreductase domain-containing protein n=1 Tax=Candidatus Methanogaster sp. ANME-2c ERB4 TaxID=2759911 RepID=A0A7G9YIE2_9EURY|nr:hypothetical protein FMEMAFBA_00034 [Methanosarcinales archaeon ANME-2c ERB4]
MRSLLKSRPASDTSTVGISRAACITLILTTVTVLVTGCADYGDMGQRMEPNMEKNAEKSTEQKVKQSADARIVLPEPEVTGGMSIEEALSRRRSVRSYKDEPITLKQVSQLLWAAQGRTSSDGFRTAPSAGALYPLEVYIVAGDVDLLSDGIYHYQVDEHALRKINDCDQRRNLSACALSQNQITDAAIDIVFTAVFERTTVKYGDRGVVYVYIEAGHAAQNVYLQAEAINLGVCAVGAFYEDEVSELLALPDDEIPVYILSVGQV